MKKVRLVPIVALALFVLIPHLASAYSISTIPLGDQNDFVLEPGKVEVYLDPGQTMTKNIAVSNRTRQKVTFKIETEDFTGSDDPTTPVVLLEGDSSPYSFRANIVPEIASFSLEPGQRITIPVKIQAPAGQQPGGYYSSVLVSNEPSKDLPGSSDSTAGKTKTISRLGVLFFVRVNGPADEKGELSEFRLKGSKKLFYQKGPFTFEILYKNSGNVHLVPYGKIEVTNLFGQKVASLPVDAYFSLPRSMRYREVVWSPGFLLGRYVAHLTLNRGYGQLVDTEEIVVWVLPWKFLLIVLAVAFGMFTIVYYVRSNFEFRRKPRE